MTTFIVKGLYDNDDVVPEEGRVEVTPSVLPLVGVGHERVYTNNIRGKVHQGKVEIELPAAGAFLPEFSLHWFVRLNSGFTHEFEFMPFAPGEEVLLSDITTIPLPIPPGTELQFAQDVYQARDRAETAADEAEDALQQIIELGGSGTISLQQTTPAAQWNFEHPPGLRRHPVILLDDDPTHPVYTDVEHVSDTLTLLLFPEPVSGWAYL